MATAHLWTLLLNKARQGRAIDLDIRCDAPDYRRLVHLNICQEGDLLCCTATIIYEEKRPLVSLLDPKSRDSNDFVVCCSWCKKLQTSAAWLEVEEAVNELCLFQSPSLPRVTHGACPACYSKVMAEIEYSFDQ
jgi:hypothetical protein